MQGYTSRFRTMNMNGLSMKRIIEAIVSRQDLSEEETEYSMRLIMSGEATQAQIGAFLTGLRFKGESIGEITACARVMRLFCRSINPKTEGKLVDTCGTGGDFVKTFNVSTISALVVAGVGVPVAKHGNRSVTSRCGSADLFEALGVEINAEPDVVERCIEEVGIGFMFAPTFHPAMKNVLGPRREIGIRTIFNVLGPLTNPANADAQLIGVFTSMLTEKLAGVVGRLGVERAFVVHGQGGIDEISITGKTLVSELIDGSIKTYIIKPEDYGMKIAKIEQILGGDLEENVSTALRVLSGLDGSKTDMVVLNSAFAIAAGGKVESVDDGIEVARESIESGRAMEKLQGLIVASGGKTSRIERLLEDL